MLRGRAAEDAAAEALRAAGFTVIETNARFVGSELDIIARDPDGLVFVEVRARGPGDVEPSATLGSTKLRHLLKGARLWLSRRAGAETPWRFVVVGVDLDEAGRPVATTIIEDPFVHLPEFHHGDP